MKKILCFIILMFCISSAECFEDPGWTLIGNASGKHFFNNRFEYDLFYDVVRDIERKKIIEGGNKNACNEPQSSYTGSIGSGKGKFEYSASYGQIDVWSDSKSYTFPAQDIFEALSHRAALNHHGDDQIEGQALWPLVPIVVILADHLACHASNTTAVTYCNSTCNCGVMSYSYTCIMGRISASCSCYECPQEPNLISYYPLYGDWSGPLVRGIATLYQPGYDLVIEPPYTSQP